jgi:hypothetical protein
MRTERAPENLGGQVAIRNGNQTQIISPGQALTPAQAMALQQILSTGTQSIVLGHLGNAVGDGAVVPDRAE